MFGTAFSSSWSFAFRGDSHHCCSLGSLQRIYLLLQFQAHPCAIPPLPPSTTYTTCSGVHPVVTPEMCPLWPGPSQQERHPSQPLPVPQGRSSVRPSECRWGESSIPTHPTHLPAFAILVSIPTTSLSPHSNSLLCFLKMSPILSSILSLAADSSCCYNNEQQPSQISQTLPHFPACIQIISLGVNTLSSSSSLCHLPARGRLLPLGGCWPSAPLLVPPFPSVHALQPSSWVHTHELDHTDCPTHPLR